jgi:hypothetical protein
MPIGSMVPKLRDSMEGVFFGGFRDPYTYTHLLYQGVPKLHVINSGGDSIDPILSKKVQRTWGRKSTVLDLWAKLDF